MNILTFDIEDWFHILDHKSTKTEKDWRRYESRMHLNMDRIFRLLEETQQKATFFCLGWVARQYPDIIQEIDARGYEIATHSDLHQLAYEQNRAQFAEDLKRSIQSLEDVTGKKIRAYRAPGFSIKEQNKWALELLLENGIEIDCSIFPASRSHGGFQNFGFARPGWIEVGGMRLKEFPINVAYLVGKPFIFSGGGYFRAFPLPVLNRLLTQSEYVMTYFHPRDFDPDQPVLPDLSLARRFKSYYGLGSSYDKLQHWLQRNHFSDLESSNQAINWDAAPVYSL